MFSRKQIIKLLAPLAVEQIMTVLVGMVDVAMVAAVGESVISSASLVNPISVLIIQIMGALAIGRAVISAQYLGKRQSRDARKAVGQLILMAMLVSIIIADTALVGRPQLLGGIFGKVEQDVMDNAQTYFRITALSYPFIGLYNACATLFRSMGNSEVSMMTSFVMNMISITGSVICAFGLKMDVTGMVWPTLTSRVTVAFMMFALIQSGNDSIRLNNWKFLISDRHMIKNILSIRIPNRLESGMFQFGKIFLQSLVFSLGTVSITSFAMASNLVTVLYLPRNAIGLGLVIIVGQYVGAGRLKEARNDTKFLTPVVYRVLAVFSTTMIIWSGPLVGIYHLSPRATPMARELLLTRSMAMMIWSLAFTIPHALRVSLGAKFTMAISVFSMWVFRIGFAYLFVYMFDLDLSGIWYGMFVDWIFRALVPSGRFRGFEKRTGIVE